MLILCQHCFCYFKINLKLIILSMNKMVNKIQKFVGYKIEINKISEDEKSILINEIVNQKKVLI